MRCGQNKFGHIKCDRDIVAGEEYCIYHLPLHLRDQITKLKALLSQSHDIFHNTSMWTQNESVRNWMKQAKEVLE